MSAFSNYTEDNIVNWFRGTAFPAAPTNLYVSYHTADPTDAGTGAEVSGGSYARVTVAANATEWSNTAGVLSNVNDINFPDATANWGTVTHVGVWDAASTGNLLFHGALSSSIVVNSGQTNIKIAAGDLDLTVA
jgi:hypothetical protein